MVSHKRCKEGTPTDATASHWNPCLTQKRDSCADEAAILRQNLMKCKKKDNQGTVIKFCLLLLASGNLSLSCFSSCETRASYELIKTDHKLGQTLQWIQNMILPCLFPRSSLQNRVWVVHQWSSSDQTRYKNTVTLNKAKKMDGSGLNCNATRNHSTQNLQRKPSRSLFLLRTKLAKRSQYLASAAPANIVSETLEYQLRSRHIPGRNKRLVTLAQVSCKEIPPLRTIRDCVVSDKNCTNGTQKAALKFLPSLAGEKGCRGESYCVSFKMEMFHLLLSLCTQFSWWGNLTDSSPWRPAPSQDGRTSGPIICVFLLWTFVSGSWGCKRKHCQTGLSTGPKICTCFCRVKRCPLRVFCFLATVQMWVQHTGCLTHN